MGATGFEAAAAAAGSTAADPASLGLRHYAAVLRRRRWLVLAITLLGVVAAAAYLVIAPRTVTASTSVNVNVITADPFNPQRPASGLLDPQTEAGIASSHVVAAQASELLGGELTPTEVRQASQVTSAGGASIIRVAFTGGSEQQATRGADAVADAYLSFRSDQAERRIDAMRSRTNDRIAELNESLFDADRDLAAAKPGTSEFAEALSRQQQLQTEVNTLLSDLNALSNVDTTGGVVLTAASDSSLEIGPSRKLTLATGLVGGLVLGVIAAFVRDPLDRRLRSARDIAGTAGGPQLARVRRGQTSENIADDLAVVRERLIGRVFDRGPVLVYDARRSPEKSAAIAELVGAPRTGATGGAADDTAAGADADSREQTGSTELNSTEKTGTEKTNIEKTNAEQSGNAEHGAARLEFVELSTDSRRAECIAALRSAAGVLLVANPRTALAAEVRWIRDEAAAAETPVLGVVIDES